eukprot:5639864-Pyramimonas_sp.AAC.4
MLEQLDFDKVEGRHGIKFADVAAKNQFVEASETSRTASHLIGYREGDVRCVTQVHVPFPQIIRGERVDGLFGLHRGIDITPSEITCPSLRATLLKPSTITCTQCEHVS